MSIEEMFAALYAMIHYCTSIAGAALVVGLVCIVGMFVMLLCLVVIDRKINYMREAMGILPPESPKPSLVGKKKKRTDALECQNGSRDINRHVDEEDRQKAR